MTAFCWLGQLILEAVDLRQLRYEKSDELWLLHHSEPSLLPYVVKNRPSSSWQVTEWGERVGTCDVAKGRNGLAKQGEMLGEMGNKWGEMGLISLVENEAVKWSKTGPEKLEENEVAKQREMGLERLAENEATAQGENDAVVKQGHLPLVKEIAMSFARLIEYRELEDENETQCPSQCLAHWIPRILLGVRE